MEQENEKGSQLGCLIIAAIAIIGIAVYTFNSQSTEDFIITGLNWGFIGIIALAYLGYKAFTNSQNKGGEENAKSNNNGGCIYGICALVFILIGYFLLLSNLEVAKIIGMVVIGVFCILFVIIAVKWVSEL